MVGSKFVRCGGGKGDVCALFPLERLDNVTDHGVTLPPCELFPFIAAVIAQTRLFYLPLIRILPARRSTAFRSPKLIVQLRCVVTRRAGQHLRSIAAVPASLATVRHTRCVSLYQRCGGTTRKRRAGLRVDTRLCAALPFPVINTSADHRAKPSICSALIGFCVIVILMRSIVFSTRHSIPFVPPPFDQEQVGSTKTSRCLMLKTKATVRAIDRVLVGCLTGDD